MKAKRNKLFITQCVATAELAAASAVLPYFAGGNKSLAVNGLVIYWALYLFRGGADTFAAAAFLYKSGNRLHKVERKWRRSDCVWRLINGFSFFLPGHWSPLSWQSIPHIVCPTRACVKSAKRLSHADSAAPAVTALSMPNDFDCVSGINFIPGK